jgi:dTDP-4-dehydrorhamnose 3,5-epimerase-like enzyme
VNDVSAEFDPTKRAGIRWDDEALGVEWPTRSPLLSPIDRDLPTLRELYPHHARFGR